MKIITRQQNPQYFYSQKNVQNSSKQDLLKQNNITFGVANSGKLKQLFSYGLPCMYSGVEMIDPKRVQRLLKNNAFNAPLTNILQIFAPYEKSLQDVEARVWKIIKEQAVFEPNKDLKQTFETLAPIYKKRLKKQQTPIFEKLIELSHKLPDRHKYKFKQFMTETEAKVNERPILIPFSAKEFKYKLYKIREDLKKDKNVKTAKVMNKLSKETEKLSAETNSRTIDSQINIINFLDTILKTSILKNNDQLKLLLSDAKQKLNQERVVVPFNRKSFIYDLAKITKDFHDEELETQMLLTAQQLPTSRTSVSAYITKFSRESSDKIGYRLLWPFLASVEHIFPKSCGGADTMSNFGGACTRENSDRKSIDFVCQIKRRPQTKIFCQQYVDRLIQLLKDGVFAKLNIDKKYIENFKKTIKTQSKGAIVLDTSALKQ